jgi:GNAT superfamily N-acetyltransferase
MSDHAQIEQALEVFVRGFSYEKTRTHPYECFRVGPLWVMRDAERKNARNYRKEEWVAYRVTPADVDRAARAKTRGRFFVCALSTSNDEEAELREGYKALGYRLLVTETLFIQTLDRIPRVKRPTAAKTAGPISIEQVRTPELAARFGKATRTKPIPDHQLNQSAPFRQYVAVEDEEVVGWVRSVDAAGSTWCSNMYVRPTHRRRGIGRALLARMLQDDRRRSSRQSVLLSSHTGALLYPHLGYEPLGILFIFAPRKR